jgi:hypothetical protein
MMMPVTRNGFGMSNVGIANVVGGCEGRTHECFYRESSKTPGPRLRALGVGCHTPPA